MKKVFKQIGTCLGIVLLGILGTALWEIAINPLLPHLRDIVLDTVSLGIQSVKDGTYELIAKGVPNHPQFSSDFLSFGLTIFLSFIILAVGTVVIEAIRKVIYERQGKPKKKETEEFKFTRKFAKWTGNVAFAILILFVSIWLYNSMRISYANSALMHYRQVLRICEPYLNDNDKKSVVSSFAQIRKRDDYLAVVKSLEKLAGENGQYVPQFKVW